MSVVTSFSIRQANNGVHLLLCQTDSTSGFAGKTKSNLHIQFRKDREQMTYETTFYTWVDWWKFTSTLLESGFLPRSKSSPSSFCRELGELLSAEFNPKSDSAMTSNLAELCLCQVPMKNNWANKTNSVEYQFHRVPNRKNSANTDMWATPCSKRLLQREGCSQRRRNVHVLLMAVLKSILVLGKNACSWARPLVFSPLWFVLRR